MGRRMLTVADRVEISTGLKAGWSIRRIAAHIDRAPSVVCREIARNTTKTRGYRLVSADEKAKERRARPQEHKVAADPLLRARALADLKRSRTPRQITGRLTLEAQDASVGPVKGSPSAQGHSVSHEGIYRYIYALPKGELARHGIMLRTKRTRRRTPKPAGQRGVPIVGMVSIEDRDPEADERRVPGQWESQWLCQAASGVLVGDAALPRHWSNARPGS